MLRYLGGVSVGGGGLVALPRPEPKLLRRIFKIGFFRGGSLSSTLISDCGVELFRFLAPLDVVDAMEFGVERRRESEESVLGSCRGGGDIAGDVRSAEAFPLMVGIDDALSLKESPD